MQLTTLKSLADIIPYQKAKWRDCTRNCFKKIVSSSLKDLANWLVGEVNHSPSLGPVSCMTCLVLQSMFYRLRWNERPRDSAKGHFALPLRRPKTEPRRNTKSISAVPHLFWVVTGSWLSAVLDGGGPIHEPATQNKHQVRGLPPVDSWYAVNKQIEGGGGDTSIIDRWSK